MTTKIIKPHPPPKALKQVSELSAWLLDLFITELHNQQFTNTYPEPDFLVLMEATQHLQKAESLLAKVYHKKNDGKTTD